jgi:predicted metalloprotease with PDZ domain
MQQRFLTACALACAAFVAPAAARAQAQPTVALAVDATDVTRGLLHVKEHVLANPGAFTLVYPKWLPGEHGPLGPIQQLASLVVTANGQRLPWVRDTLDLYSFHVTVPAGVTALDLSYDFLGGEYSPFDTARLASPTTMVLAWNKVVLSPQHAQSTEVTVQPTITLPGADWKYATALEESAHDGTTVRFNAVTVDQLVDSPLDAGLNVKTWPLGEIDGAPVTIAVFADTPEELDVKDATIGKLRNLVREMGALYGARHFRHYTFLLTVSDVLPGEGLEHHQSSDDGADGDFLVDEHSLVGDGDLLPHEFNHSWNGKFRRPYDLYTPNLQVPMQDDLLWVYEGMTQFYGELNAERSGIWTKQQWLDALADTYATLDTTTGRATRPLVDTATNAASFGYGAPPTFANIRRGLDYYPEGALMWLEADGIIRKATGGKRSIDDFARAFFGRTSTGPEVVTYTRDDIIAGLNAVAPYDWRAFLAAHIDAIAPHPPDPFTEDGWKVVFKPEASGYESIALGRRKALELRYSLGLVARADGSIVDVIQGSPAARAGVGPGTKILGVNGRTYGGQKQIDAALRAAQNGGPAVRMLLSGGETYREVTFDYHDGPKYPALERIAGTPDVLSIVAKPKRPDAK